MTSVPSHDEAEQLIGALIPASLPRQRPPPLPAVDLPPPPTLLRREIHVELFASRVDPSGRIPALAAAAALDWSPGTRLGIDVFGRCAVLGIDDSAPARGVGLGVVVRAKIGLPIAVRRLCVVEPGSTVVLAALVSDRLLVIHPAAELVRLLRPTYRRILGGRRGD